MSGWGRVNSKRTMRDSAQDLRCAEVYSRREAPPSKDRSLRKAMRVVSLNGGRCVGDVGCGLSGPPPASKGLPSLSPEESSLSAGLYTPRKMYTVIVLSIRNVPRAQSAQKRHDAVLFRPSW